jgi:chemotaxis family two-component system response regulator Rcp1
MMSSRPLVILLVEDNYGDERLVHEALMESNGGTKLNVVRNGVDALSYLRKEDNYAESARPDLVFLDVNIPKKSGIEVLAEIKSDPDLKSIPVLMLTTSDSLKDKARCIFLKADEYIRKPVDLNDFLRLITAVEKHWKKKLALGTSKLATKSTTLLSRKAF